MLKYRATKLALADSTSRSYDSKFRIFLSFCSFAVIDISHISPVQILTFLEFLTFNNVSFSGLANHLSAVKTSLSLHGLDVSSFMDPRIKLYNKAIMRHRPFNPSIKPIIDIDTLQAIALQCDRMHMGHICKAAILLAFFSFLRISNLVPHSIVFVFVFLYSAQYLHMLQDTKRYLTYPTELSTVQARSDLHYPN